jgi:hypothetical protein
VSERDGARLRAMLATVGVVAAVEARGALALVVPGDAAVRLSNDARQALLEAARACGFSHLALEVTALTGQDA